MRNTDHGDYGHDDGTAEYGMGFGFSTSYRADTGLIEFTIHLFGEIDHEFGMNLTVQQAMDVADLFALAIGDAIEIPDNQDEMEF
ncbi:hypothetical protein VMT65_12200 [Nocardia sp. CDC153]|uniref:hypothetical protein n=1 Tax=Nocardia sp. CDC153 TaxID=3112167 RepID=UPI002DBB9BAC|nr:hypothetical protein [Nocardia sp. CDC153]MEC3953792.1 hypothetical protein [Nocardia sp. CDC153]